jgi:hypothetical protein
VKRLGGVLVLAIPLLTACGGNGSTGSGGNGGNGGNGGAGGSTVDSNKLEDVCHAFAAAAFGSACPPKQYNQEQLFAQCVGQGAAYQDGCGQEFVNAYDCIGKGGFSCVNGQPVQNSVCPTEQQALQTCVIALPCKKFCAAATTAGCAPADCVNQCNADIKSFGVECQGEYSTLLACWGQGVTCENGKPSIKGCEQQVALTAHCLSTFGANNNECDGYCWAADKLGCGANCATDCKAKLADQKCGSEYRNLIDCAVGPSQLQLACNGSTPTPTSACSSDQMSYESCTSM